MIPAAFCKKKIQIKNFETQVLVLRALHSLRFTPGEPSNLETARGGMLTSMLLLISLLVFFIFTFFFTFFPSDSSNGRVPEVSFTAGERRERGECY